MEGEVPTKKRKRTGKQREEAKKAAIAAQAQAADVKTSIGQETHLDEGDGAMKLAALDLQDVEKRIPRALRALNPILKQAKVFEVRRLVKKVKFLRTKETAMSELADLESQLEALSHLHLDPVIRSHILLKLQKHPRLKHETLPLSLTTTLATKEQPSTSAQSELSAKVENRLCSNKAVSDGVKSAISWILGEEGAKLPAKVINQQPASTTEGQKRSTQTERLAQGKSNPIILKPIAEINTENEVEIGSVTGLEEDSDDEGEAVGEAGWESGSISGNEGDIAIGPYESESDEDAVISIPRSPPTKKSKIKPQASADVKKAKGPSAKTPIISSTFLPTLSSGFIMGDSDSDPDLDPDVDGSGMVGNKAVRKNRRGQRARQAIWEKKYGKNAKHVKKAQEGENSKTAANRTAMGQRGGISGRGRGAYGMSGSYRNQAEVHTAAPPTAAIEAKKSIHPSWEAAKLRQKRQMGAVQPQGTKIVFD